MVLIHCAGPTLGFLVMPMDLYGWDPIRIALFPTRIKLKPIGTLLERIGKD